MPPIDAPREKNNHLALSEIPFAVDKSSHGLLDRKDGRAVLKLAAQVVDLRLEVLVNPYRVRGELIVLVEHSFLDLLPMVGLLLVLALRGAVNFAFLVQRAWLVVCARFVHGAGLVDRDRPIGRAWFYQGRVRLHAAAFPALVPDHEPAWLPSIVVWVERPEAVQLEQFVLLDVFRREHRRHILPLVVHNDECVQRAQFRHSLYQKLTVAFNLRTRISMQRQVVQSSETCKAFQLLVAHDLILVKHEVLQVLQLGQVLLIRNEVNSITRKVNGS